MYLCNFLPRVFQMSAKLANMIGGVNRIQKDIEIA